MKKGNNLTCITGILSMALGAFWLTGCGDNGNGGGGNTAPNAPQSIAGRSITHVITSGTDPFPTAGTYVLHAEGASGDTSGNYSITGSGGVTNSSGTYTYSLNDTNSASLNLEDSALGSVQENLLFQTGGSGTFQSTAGAGSQSGNFTLH